MHSYQAAGEIVLVGLVGVADAEEFEVDQALDVTTDLVGVAFGAEFSRLVPRLVPWLWPACDALRYPPHENFGRASPGLGLLSLFRPS